jgi:hypothetical protein
MNSGRRIRIPAGVYIEQSECAGITAINKLK